MSISYRIFASPVSGGPVDLTTPIGTTSSLTFSPPALGHRGSWTFLVRAFDTISGIEDLNTDARVTIILDAAGNDITGRPASPTNLSASATLGGGIRVEWAFLPVSGSVNPTGFKVWVQVGALNYALAPTATISTYDPDRVAWLADVPGLTDGTVYTVGVRAFNATGDDGNDDTVTVAADATGPLPVADLGGRPTF